MQPVVGGMKMPVVGGRNDSCDMLTENQHELLAQTLYQAYERCEPLSPLSDIYPQMETADSYAIQARVVARHGSQSVGYKLGFTSAAMREQMGVDEPNYGVLLAATRAIDEVPHNRFIHPLIEPEIAVITGRDLAGDDVALDQIVAAVDSLHAAIEIVDSRFEDYRFQAVDNIADNSSAAGYCLGPGVETERVPEPASLVCRLIKNEQQIAEGRGVDAMGGPYQALQWLVHKLAEQGQGLPAGSLVLTGGLSRAQMAQPGDSFRVEFADSLQPVKLQLVNG